MEKDKFACYEWAKKQTGFDPMKTPTPSTPPPSDSGTSASPMRGAAGGALAGLTIGSLAGNAGKGAAIGAVGGGDVVCSDLGVRLCCHFVLALDKGRYGKAVNRISECYQEIWHSHHLGRDQFKGL
jgi:hypothetical protein